MDSRLHDALDWLRDNYGLPTEEPPDEAPQEATGAANLGPVRLHRMSVKVERKRPPKPLGTV